MLSKFRMLFFSLTILFSFVCVSFLSFASYAEGGNELIDFQAFMEVSKEAREHRLTRRVDESTFIEMAAEENTIILDTRSAAAFSQKHIKGATHLNFSDFTRAKLAKVIPDKGTRILIYCNNNFANDDVSFQSKEAPLALNIPTFINLYGYGYKNVYELTPLLDIEKTKIPFEGSLVR